MRALLLVLFVCFVSSANAVPRKHEIRTPVWLERGCAMVVLCDQDREDATEAQKTDAFEMLAWLDGFMSGVTSSNVLLNNEVLTPPESWRSPAVIAPLILQFIRTHKATIHPEISAWRLMLGWYMTMHPDSPDQVKQAGEKIIQLQPKGAAK